MMLHGIWPTTRVITGYILKNKTFTAFCGESFLLC